MATRGKRAGKRGSTFNKSLRVAVQSILDIGSTSEVVANGKGGKNAYTPAMNPFYENGEEDLYRENGLVPRKSLSAKQHLAAFGQTFEREDLTLRQLDKSSPETIAAGKMISGTYSRVTWASDKTLIRGSKVDQMPQGFHRTTSRTKITKWEAEPLAPEGSLSWSKPDDRTIDPILADMKIEPADTK